MYKHNFDLKFIILLIVSVYGAYAFAAEPWSVPADKKVQNSYLKFDEFSAKEGGVIYEKNCASCHGNPSKKNGLQSLNPIPPDLASVSTQAYTDGELFYILNVGRSLMPSFNNVLTESERWKVISYLRGFNKDYVQVLSKTDPTKSQLVKVKMIFDALTNKLNVNVSADNSADNVVLIDAEVVLFVKRYFGRLQIDKTLRTDSRGSVGFNFPDDLPGDKDGNLELIVKVNAVNYGEVESVDTLKIGVPTNKPGLTEKRALWNVMAKAPYWIIFAYLFGILVVTSVLLYIIFSLYKMWKKGNTI